jgi:glycosyltransferase involved in cell wall biosynthesis
MRSQGRSVLHVMHGVHPTGGGPPAFLKDLVRKLQPLQIQSTVATVCSGEAETSMPGETVRSFRCTVRHYWISFSYLAWIWRSIDTFDLVHIHLIFSFPALIAAYLAKRRRIPYIVQPHGLLGNWPLKTRRPQLKRLWIRLFERRILRNAAAVICASEQEMEQSQQAVPTESYHVIPYSVDKPPLAKAALAESFHRVHPELSGYVLVLFLSRIDPMKGLEVLLTAWRTVQRRFPQTRLVIAGSGSANYTNHLKSLCARLDILKSVVFLGFLFEGSKWEAFAAADVFVLPSHYESFGIAVLEALRSGLPVIVSDQVPMSRIVANGGAGLAIRCDVAELAAALNTVLASTSLRHRMQNGALSISDSFATLDEVALKMKEVYVTAMKSSRSARTHTGGDSSRSNYGS